MHVYPRSCSHVTGSTADALREITRHFGGPVLNHLTRLPRLNRPVLDEVRTIKCSTRSQLEQHYRPWNQRLYEHLRNDHAHSMAPPMERKFEFPAVTDGVECAS